MGAEGDQNQVIAWQRQNVNILYSYTARDPGTVVIVFPNVSGRSAPMFAATAASRSTDVWARLKHAFPPSNQVYYIYRLFCLKESVGWYSKRGRGKRSNIRVVTS